MTKEFNFFMKPIYLRYFVFFLVPIIYVIVAFTEADINALLLGFFSGLLGVALTLLLIYKSNQLSQLFNSKLLLSLPNSKSRIIKYWYISNHLSVYIIMLIAIVSFLGAQLITSSNQVTTFTYIILLCMGLISNIIVNLITPISFINSYKRLGLFKIMIIAFILILYVGAIVSQYILTSFMIKSIYLIVLISIYLISTYFSYKKALVNVRNIEL